MYSFTLPLPPSNNHYLRYFCARSTEADPHEVRAVLTPRTRQYKHDAGWLAKDAGVRTIEGPVELVVDIYLGPKQRYDSDNVLKVLQDCMNGIAWEDDEQVVRTVVNKHRGRGKARVEVTIRAKE